MEKRPFIVLSAMRMRALLRVCAAALLLASGAGCGAGEHYDDVSKVCTACAGGQFSAGGLLPKKPASCTACSAGQRSGSGATSCTACGSGKISGSGESTCAACAAGQYANGQHKKCVACAGGTFSDSDAQGSCTACAAGRHSNAQHLAPCPACEPGQHSSSSGASSCIKCTAGQYANGQHKTCVACADGTHSSSGTQGSCTACAAGRHSNTQHMACPACLSGKISGSGKSVCHACDAGQHSNPGHTACPDCAAGQFSGDTAGSSCRSCVSGQYSGRKAPICKHCPGNSNSSAASPAVSDCHCSPGYTGTILSDTSSCAPCDKGRSGMGGPGVPCINCHPGTYQDQPARRSCISCEGKNGCSCQGIRNDWPAGAGGICRQGPACRAHDRCEGTQGYPGATCTAAGLNNSLKSAEYECHCVDVGIFGLTCDKTCQNELDTSHPNLPWCGNLGRCVHDPDPDNKLSYLCNCTEGWSGKHCKIMDPCIVLQPCSNGAACNTSSAEPTGYKCDCPTGFSGHNCATLTSAWDGYDAQVEMLVAGAAIAVCYFGVYWRLIQVSGRRPAASGCKRYVESMCQHLVCEMSLCVALCLGLAIIAALWNQPCGRITRITTPHPGPQPGPQGEGSGSGSDSPAESPEDSLLFSWLWHVFTHVASDPEPDADPFLPEPASQSPFTHLKGEQYQLWLRLPFWRKDSFPEAKSSCTRAAIGVANALTLYGSAAVMTILQSLVVVCFYKWSAGRFPDFATEGASRLQRGAGLPLLVLLLASPGVAVGILLNPDRLDPPRVDIVADMFVIYGWDAITFGVLLPCLPIAAVVAQLYLKEQRRGRDDSDDRGRCENFLIDCGVPDPKLFLRAEKSSAALSGLLCPFFWNAHMVNEQQEFLTFADAERTEIPLTSEVRYTRETSTEYASVDGVRALSPVVCSLNFVTAGWLIYMIYAFPVPLAWTLSMYFGVCWCATVACMLLRLNYMLITSLSEDWVTAANRHREVIWGWGMHGNIDLTRMPTCCDKVKELAGCIKTYATSWTGQTAISGVNHAFAIVLFLYGLHEFGDHLSPELKKFLWSGIGLTAAGAITSATSFFQRRWPRFKVTPTDDSFRLACVLKALLVMNKALIVYELSKVDLTLTPGSTPGSTWRGDLKTWTHYVTVVCVVSVLILALLTAALEACKVYSDPELIENVGIADGRKFIRMYFLSFACCKIATVFFVALGYIPWLSGCNSSAQPFEGSKDLDASIDCTVCFPSSTKGANITNSIMCAPYADELTLRVVHACKTDCATIFFSGAGTPENRPPITLDVFVLVPVLWLPFAVYSNNEVARMIDGVWQRKKEKETVRTIGGTGGLHHSARVGLSTTGHGYIAVVNLAHAVFLLCFLAMLSFLVTTRNDRHPWGGYSVTAPPGIPTKVQERLDMAGRVVTWSVIAINLLMMCRFLYEQSMNSIPRPRWGFWAAVSTFCSKDPERRERDSDPFNNVVGSGPNGRLDGFDEVDLNVPLIDVAVDSSE